MPPAGNAPGLKFSKLKSGRQPYWVAGQVVRDPKKFPHRTIRLPRDASQDELAELCRGYSAELRAWVKDQKAGRKPRIKAKPRRGARKAPPRNRGRLIALPASKANPKRGQKLKWISDEGVVSPEAITFYQEIVNSRRPGDSVTAAIKKAWNRIPVPLRNLRDGEPASMKTMLNRFADIESKLKGLGR